MINFKEDFNKGLVVVDNIDRLGQIISDISNSTNNLINDTNTYITEHEKIKSEKINSNSFKRGTSNKIFFNTVIIRRVA